ncbi:hypothetical protein N0V88_006988 [Collariella sp. IMI 366227]|nr:hypothetical protein N0V88_006988 [Collariella sp. IMI 366227]
MAVEVEVTNMVFREKVRVIDLVSRDIIYIILDAFVQEVDKASNTIIKSFVKTAINKLVKKPLATPTRTETLCKFFSCNNIIFLVALTFLEAFDAEQALNPRRAFNINWPYIIKQPFANIKVETRFWLPR